MEAETKDIVVLTDVEAIDRVLRTYPWMDFEIDTYQQGELVLKGGVALDISVTPDLFLHFEDVFFVIAPSAWKTDTDTTVLTVHDGSHALVPLKLPYRVDLGYQIFQLRPEDLEGASCWFAARSIRMRQLRLPDDGLKLIEGWNGRGGWMPLP